MKRVLIITYYWPPSGGAGVQRWIRLAGEMRQNGWEPVICIPENPSYTVTDPSLEKLLPPELEIIRTPILEPVRLLSFFSRKGDNQLNIQQKPQKSNLIKRFLWMLRGNLFIPDARVFWIRPSVRILNRYLETHPVDLIISTGPPHSAHLIALALKKSKHLPWLADFRDPWTSMDYLREMNLGPLAWRKHRQLERQVLTGADHVVVVGNTMKREFDQRYGINCTIIYNGFQSAGSAAKEIGNHFSLDKLFSIVHIGNFLRDRNCNDLWNVLQQLTQNNVDFARHLQIKLVGEVAPNVLESISRAGLDPFLCRIQYIPFSETQQHLFGAQLLLLPIDRIENAEFVLTGKLFEYLKSGRPILLLGPSEGDAAHIIRECNAGFACDFDDLKKIETTLLDRFDKYLRGENTVHTQHVDNFSSQALAHQLAELMNQLVNAGK